jgi:hypothetical protein
LHNTSSFKIENLSTWSSSEIEALLSELNQAYAVYRFLEMGYRDLPLVVIRVPESIEELLEIQEEILAQINYFTSGRSYSVSESEQINEVYVFSTDNFPNPFNPSTTIRFTVGSRGVTSSQGTSSGVNFVDRGENVLIDVYNVRGQRVRTLLDGSREYSAGRHEVVWNGRDDFGRGMSSGIYFYRITAGEDTAVRRMLLMK